MTHGIAVGVALVVGLTAGFGARLVPARPIVRTAVAALVALLLSSVASAGIWLLRPPADAEVVAVSFGLLEGLVTSVVVVVVAVVIHAFLGWIGVVTHREIIIATLAALSGALAATSSAGLVHSLK